MSEDKCLYCSAGIEKKHKGWSKLHCGSVRYDSDGTFDTFYNRHIQCYETELAALKALVREMGEVINILSTGYIPNVNPYEWMDTGKAILNRPEVRRIMEGKDGL